MADCAVARCLNERRLIRKHLQRWGKNLLFMVGLERAAQTLGGRKFGEIYPFSGLEPQEPEDWKPDETCYLCDANTSIHPSITDPPLSENQPVEACLDTCISDVLEASTAVDNKHSSDNLEQPLDLSLHRRSRQLDDNANEILEVGPTKPVLKVPQPSAAKSSKRSKVDSSSTWKRTYTEEELELALNDIQSGKLGTRRAAVIYGIPRSTLRNKVYKLANERNNNANNSGVVSSSNGNGGTINNKRKTPTSSESPSSIKSSTNTNSKSGSVLKKSPKTIKDSAPSPTENHLTAHNPASESLKQILKQVITQKANNNNNNNTSTTNYNNVGSSGISSSNKQDGDSSPYRTQNIAPSAPLFNSFEDNLAALHMLSTPDAQASVFSQLLLPYVHQFLARLDENHSTLINSCQESLISRNLSFLPDIIRKLTQERVENEKTRAKATSDDNSESTPDDGTNKVILKVPSYKMKSSTSVSNQEDDRNSLNDQGDGSTVSSHYPGDVEFEKCKDESLLKESIRVKQEKLNSKLSNSNSIYSEESSSDALNSENRPSLESCSRSDKRSSTCNSDQSNPSTPDPKRNRPKRGRYRNYDRDDLAKAVNAVQKGEMSVHKAGTIFGVPHSTLEYKVKERHLLRPKKRQSSSHTGGKRNEGKSTVTTVLPKLASSQASSPNHSANNSDATFSGTPFWQAALPFLNVDLSSHNNNFFATNMMRKLYEKRMSEENQHSNRNEFGGLLLENLIKSSLERNTGISEHEASSDMEISADHKDEDEEPQKQQSETSKFNASLAALKEVTALDKKE